MADLPRSRIRISELSDHIVCAHFALCLMSYFHYKNEKIWEWSLRYRTLNHYGFPFSRFILQPWTAQALSTSRTFHRQIQGLFGCRRDGEKACNSVCQTPTVSSMVRCWLHFPLASSAKKEQSRQKNTSRKQRDNLTICPSQEAEWSRGESTSHLNTVM